MSEQHYAEPYLGDTGVGLGFEDVQFVPAPAAGAEVVVRMPGEYISRPLAVTFTLAAGAAAPARFVHINYENQDGQSFAISVAGNTQAANQTLVYSAWGNQSRNLFNTQGFACQPLMDVFLQPGQQVAIRCFNLDAGDQLSAIAVVFERLTSKEHARRQRRRVPRRYAE